MDLEKYRDKLIGSEEERAVSPVIGVILMVAITVILAAVIAAFVLDLGDNMGDSSVNAGVSSDVSNSDQEVRITVDSMGDAEEIKLAGDVDDTKDLTLSLDSTGDSVAVTSAGSSSDADELLSDVSGEANIVAVNGDSESVVGSFEWDWSEELSASVTGTSTDSVTLNLYYDGEAVSGDDVEFTVTHVEDGTSTSETQTVSDGTVTLSNDDSEGGLTIESGTEYEIEADHPDGTDTVTATTSE